MRKKNQSTIFIKECICKAFIDLLYTKKNNEITISEICQKAGFGRTTYYRYFTNKKEDLILYISHLRWKQCKIEHADEAKKDEGMLLLQHIYYHKNFFIMLTHQKLDDLIFKIFYQEFGRKKDENEILGYGKAFFAGGYFGVIYEWIQNGCIDTPQEISLKFVQGCIYAHQLATKKQER